MKKVIVIGLDGLEPKLVEAMFSAGDLPNLAKLRAIGGYTRVRTTYPPQTPVAWSTFSTGTNPGGHGIFDFLRRDPKTYLPAFGLSRYEQKNMFLPPQVINLRRGVPMWDLLSQAGVASTIIRCPCTYPPDNIKGRMLAGVGVPDLRGGLGTSTFYSSVNNVKAEESEKVIRVQADGQGAISTHLIGPRNPKTGADFTFDITLNLEPAAGRVMLMSEGQPRQLELRVGQWSDWLKVKFKVGMLQSVHGILRFYLTRLGPDFELYASPINFDPEAPLFPISHPQEYASELGERLGTYYTTGMAEDHDGLNHERFDETAYLEQCQMVLRERRKMMIYELERFKSGLFFCLFDTPDRLQHMFWRFREPNHPANRGEPASSEMAGVIEEHYRVCDKIVGKGLEYADNESLFIVLSDHGMNSYQRGLHLNTWLYNQGWLALKNGIKPGEEAGDFFQNVDWSQTKAYALGLGGIFLNLRGREEKGVVTTDEAETVKAAIIKQLSGLPDPERDQVAVRSVVTREQIYSGPYLGEAPDLLVNFAPGYRVSWGTPLGGTPAGLFEDNTKKWGGDHMIDPDLAPGVLFMNQTFNHKAGLVDLAPTILKALGVPQGPAMEGNSLLT
jgi:predicted AlkP superfamily phosphohydrolase/phosphomutase